MNRFCSLLLVLSLSLAPLTGKSQYFDLQGHRGCRGIMPENSIPAFKKALEIGVITLELDVVVSKDKKVVVSHEPYFSSEICLDAEGALINAGQEEEYNIYRMAYSEIKRFDCGSKQNENYPQQEKISVYKPLLSDVIRICDEYADALGRTRPNYNIELKSREDRYKIYQPLPAEFTAIVYEVVNNIPTTRIIIQSFDHEILRTWRVKHPEYTLALLEESIASPEKSIEKLGFKPEIFSPHYKLLSRKKILAVHDLDVRVIPWTVNEAKDMKKLFEWGVDGIITDYPNVFMEYFPDKVH